jgi:sugar phosphate isomerase/epimerase
MNKRREFIVNSGLAISALAIMPSFAFSNIKKSIGIQLYTLRSVFPSDVKGTIERVAKIGYKEVELYGFTSVNGFFGISAKELKKILNNTGLKSPSGHFDFYNYLKNRDAMDDVKELIETAKILDCKYITIPFLAKDLRENGIDSYKLVAEKINKAAEICQSSGIQLAYHNHDFEFEKIGTTTGFEVLLNETDKNLVDFEMDLYWVIRSGNNPLQLFKDNPKRFSMWHVKDMDKIKPEWNTEIGNGSINFKEIFAYAKLSGMKHFYVEHETNYQPNLFESVEKSYNYILTNL